MCGLTQEEHNVLTNTIPTYLNIILEKLKETNIRPTIVCLCGSTKFKEAFEKVTIEKGLVGEIVLSVVGFNHADDLNYTKEQKHFLDNLHFRKIDLCDYVYVINVNGYIGESTRNEINYAKATRKPVIYLEEFSCSN